MLEQIWIVGTHPVQGYHHVDGHGGVGLGGLGDVGLEARGQVDHYIICLPHTQQLKGRKKLKIAIILNLNLSFTKSSPDADDTK